MYFDEDLLLDIRLNTLNEHINKFIITEATYTHNGEPKKLRFDISKFRNNKIDIRAANPNIYEKMLKKINNF